MEENIAISNENLIDAQYKDSSPTKTVERIKQILHSHKIETTENWNESKVEYCYSLRVSVNGTNFATNGKGLTKEFALASAYGELMERLQLGFFAKDGVQKLGYFNQDSNKSKKMMQTEKLYQCLPEWYDFLAQKINAIDKTNITGIELLSRFKENDDTMEAAEYFNLVTGETALISGRVHKIVCGTNGCAAGNSMEEAIVQAISEIIERHYKTKILHDRISLPDIPEDVIKKYSTAYSIIQNLRSKGYRVIIKDCSLGTRFPVVCVIYINEKTGKYHTHFGAYPILEIALERTLTESFQGRNIDSFAKNEDFLYSPSDLFSYKNIYNDLRVGDYLKTPDFFIGECKHSYNANVGFSGKSNSELLVQLIDFFSQQNLDIYVRDSSTLGFPTCDVFVPTYSEVLYHSLSKKYDYSFSKLEAGIMALRNLSVAGFDDYLIVLLHIDQMKKLSAVSKDIFTFANCSKLTLDCPPDDDSYLMAASLAYVYYAMDNLSLALSFVEKMMSLKNDICKDFLLCLKRYMSMKVNNYDEDDIKKLIHYFHNTEIAAKLYSYIDNGLNPFDEFVLHCDFVSCDKCIAKTYCKQKNTQRLIELVNKGAELLSFEDYSEYLKKYTIK